MRDLLASRPRVDRSFERLYKRHVADVYHYALAVLRNPADAEDVTQTTFLNAYSAYRRGEQPSAPRNWLIAIAHNVCRQRFRQSSRRPREVAFDEDVGEALVHDDGPTVHDIRTALGQLAFNQRAALVMRELEGRSYSEIADILGLTVSAVETLIFRARRALREQLEGSLTCKEAELALSLQLDGRLPRNERGPLRAHLRACPECASFARSQRAQRAALRSLAAVPIPGSLASFFGGGGATAGAGLAAKAATVVVVGAVVGGAGYEGVKQVARTPDRTPAVQTAASAAEPQELTLGSSAAVVAIADRSPAAAGTSLGGKALARARSEEGKKLVANRGQGRPAAPPGRTKARTTLGGGSSGGAKAVRARGTTHGNARTQEKPRRTSVTAAGRPEQPGKSAPPGRAKKAALPTRTAHVPHPPPPPPAKSKAPVPGKSKK